MKTSLVIIPTAVLFILVTVCNGQSGFVYDDAVSVMKANKEDINKIIAYYAGKPVASSPQIDSIIAANPFLSQSKILEQHRLALKPKKDTIMTGELTGTPNGLLGLNVTNFADGLAKFLIERGKQELSMAFFDKMKEEFKKYPELKTLFPLTVAILYEIENHNILTLLQELKDAFAKDLLNGPTNLLNLRYLEAVDCSSYDKKSEEADCEKHNKIIDKIKLAAWTRTATVSLHIAQGILNGNNIVVILGNVVTDTTFCKKSDNVSGFFKLTYVLMDMLRSKQESDGIFINEPRLRELFSNQELLTIFLGLGYQKFNAMECFKQEQLKIADTHLDKIFQSVLDGRARFIGKISSFDNVNLGYKGLKSVTLPANSLESYVSGSNLAIAGIINGLAEVLHTGVPSDLSKTLDNLNIGAGLVIDIHKKNYTGIFNDVIRFITHNQIIQDADAKAKLVKYLSFGANLASAQNSDEVKDALNAATLPPGSFSVKQKSKFSIGLNAYVGYGWDVQGKSLYGHNIYAPIGVAASWGLSKQKKRGAVSVFVSAIDVGSLVSYRLANSPTDTLKQEVRLESIISPSAQLIYAFPGLPISFCAGWKHTPKLVFEGQTEFRVVEPEDVFNVSILIDIPMFNFKVTPYD